MTDDNDLATPGGTVSAGDPPKYIIEDGRLVRNPDYDDDHDYLIFHD